MAEQFPSSSRLEELKRLRPGGWLLREPRLPESLLSESAIKWCERDKADWESYQKRAERTKSELLEALSSDLPDHHRTQLQEELESVKREITTSISKIQDCERKIQDNERKLAERRGADVERQRKEDSKRLFEEAMKDGYVKLNIINMLLSGVAGSGKTSLKYLLTDQPPPEQRSSTSCMEKPLRVEIQSVESGKTSLNYVLTDQPPPEQRSSTPCMEKPLRVDVRSVTSSKFKTTGRGWVEISQDKLLDLLSRIIALHQKKSSVQSVQGEKVTEALQEKTLRSKVTSASEKYLPIKEASESHEAINDTIESLKTEILQKLTRRDEPASVLELGGEMFDSTWVYISDCGGQPQFHEISPLFIQHISVAAVVFRLTDDFSSFPLDEYYKDGKRVGLPRASHMTLEETLKSLIRSIESHCSQEKKPSLMFVGTFLDQLLSMHSLEEKNRAILDILPADMENQVKYSDGWQHPIFALNAVSREDSVLACAESIRRAIEACAPLEIKVPIWWSLLDIILQNLSFKLGRGVLSKQECSILAILLGFREKDLEAALYFFDEVCIAHYYPSILPDTIFINAQIPLDKISELTEYAITLRNPNLKGLMDGKMKRLAGGIITLEFLMLDRFKKHYVEGVFSPDDMLLIMKELLVIAPIPLVGETESPLSKAEFLMPSLLESVPPADLEKHRISTISPIALYFPSGCIRSGVFCCLVVYVMKVLKWSLSLPSGERLFVSKNCIKFSIPNRTYVVTLIDSFSYIEIHVEAPPMICSKLCPDIYAQVLKGIRASCEVLHYNNDSPNVGIFCPCGKSGTKRHLATVNFSEGFWSCSLQKGVWEALKSIHKVWNGSLYVAPPTILKDYPQSLSIKEGENVCLEVQTEGTHLSYLWHKNGVHLREGHDDYHGVATSTLSISRASIQHEGEYHCVVSNEEEQVTSQPQTLSVVEPPSLLYDQQSSKKVTENNSISLSVQTKGTGFVYLWCKDGDPLNESQNYYQGVATPTLSISRVTVKHNGEYHCVVSNEVGRVSSQPRTLFVVVPPSLVSDHPQDERVKSEQSVTLSVQVKGTDLTCQWSKDGIPLSGDDDHYHGVTTPILFISRASIQHEGMYRCVVSNEAGRVTSQPQTLSVVEPPFFITNNQPSSRKVIKNNSISFSVQAKGTDLKYLWHKDGNPLREGHNHYEGVATSTLTISRSSLKHEGEYHCVVSNEEGQVTSQPQTLSVVVPPSLVPDRPQDKRVKCEQSIILAIQAKGTNLTYQWSKDGIPFSSDENYCYGVTTPTLSISKATLQHKGEYHCVVSNEAGQVTSQPQTLCVVEPPFFINNNQPSSRKVIDYNSISISVQAKGTDLMYLWHKDGNPLGEGQNHYKGVATPTLTISRASIQHKGEYHCVVSNEAGQVTSQPQTLFVVVPPSLVSDRPQHKLVKSERSVSLSVQAKGTDLTYQWSKDGVPLSGDDDHYHGVTTPSLTISQASLKHSGEYRCVVDNEGGSVTSSPFNVVVEQRWRTRDCFWLIILLLSIGLVTVPWILGMSESTTGGGSQSTHAVDSVQELVKMLSDIGNWEALCTNLGVRQAVMSELIHSPLDVSIKKKRCLESYFNSGHAHWEEVIRAVVGPSIFNERVAKKIADKYLLDYKTILKKDEL